VTSPAEAAVPTLTNGFARVGLIVGRFRGMDPDATIAAVATADGGAERLTYGDLRELLSAAAEASNRLGRIAMWHSRETAPGGMVGDHCTECGNLWPCDTRKLADGVFVDPDDAGPASAASVCGDWPAPCNCDDPVTHNGH
jgi:hypothetical protein